jgi:hypothetical protein
MATSSFVKLPFASLAAVVTAAVVSAGCEAEPPAAPAQVQVRPLAFPGAAGSGQPRLTADVDGAPLLSWLEPSGAGHALRYARLESGAFTAPREIASGENLFVNWADLPSVQPITASVWAAHWLTLAPESAGAYHIATAVSADAGRTWSAPVQLNDDSANAEHGFVQLFAWDDAIGAFWLDGRQLAEWSFDAPDALLGTSLRVAKLDYSGAVTSREIVDELVCDCCQPDMTMTASGPVVAYRDRTPDEIRDIVVRRRIGSGWSEATPVGADGWRIEGCPVNGPALAANGDAIAVAWFTAANDAPRVRLARSEDAGASFAPPIEIDGAGSFGQVGVLLARDGTAIVTWWRRAAAGGTDLALRTVAPDGALGDVHVLAHSPAFQPLDVPQVIAAGGAVLVAWTSLEGSGEVRALLVDGLL